MAFSFFLTQGAFIGNGLRIDSVRSMRPLKYQNLSAPERARRKAQIHYHIHGARFATVVDRDYTRLLRRHLLRFVHERSPFADVALLHGKAPSVFSFDGAVRNVCQIVEERAVLLETSFPEWWVHASTERQIATRRVGEALLRLRGLEPAEWTVYTEENPAPLRGGAPATYARLQYFRLAMAEKEAHVLYTQEEEEELAGGVREVSPNNTKKGMAAD